MKALLPTSLHGRVSVTAKKRFLISYSLLASVIILPAFVFAMEPVVDEKGFEIVLPVPQEIGYGGYASLDSACIVTQRNAGLAEQLGVNDFCVQVESLGGKKPAVIAPDADTAAFKTIIHLSASEPTDPILKALSDPRRKESYRIDFELEKERQTIRCVGSSGRGANYALQTLLQLLNRQDGKVVLRLAQVRDWPAIEMRLIPWGINMNTNQVTDRCIEIMKVMSRYKLNVFAPGRGTAWGAWGDPEERERIQACIAPVANYARDTDLIDYAQSLHLAEDQKIQMDVTIEDRIRRFEECLQFAVREGAKCVYLQADDACPYSKAEEKVYGPKLPHGHARAHAYLVNRLYKDIRQGFPNTLFLYVPPWMEENNFSYAGRATAIPGTEEFAKLIPPDVGIVWTGPAVWSHRIPKKELEDFYKYMSGHKPFLWDNTIYSRWRDQIGPLTLFSPYAAAFPDDLPDLIFKGIHLNTDEGELSLCQWPTFACYAWNPQSYTNSWKVMDIALRKQFGPELAQCFHVFRENYVDIKFILADLFEQRQKIPLLKRMPGIPQEATLPLDEKQVGEMCDRLYASMAQIEKTCRNKRLVEELRKLLSFKVEDKQLTDPESVRQAVIRFAMGKAQRVRQPAEASRIYLEKLNAWTKEVNESDVGLKERWFDPRTERNDWREITCPMKMEDPAAQYMGFVWFHKDIEIPAAWIGKDLLLCLGPIDDSDLTFVNGEQVGNGEAWKRKTQRQYRIAAGLVTTGTLTVVVRVMNIFGAGGMFGTEKDYRLTLDPAVEEQKPLSMAGMWRCKRSADIDSKTRPVRDTASQEAAVITRLEIVLAARQKFLAEDVLAELEKLIPGDPRLVGFRERVASVPGPDKEITVDLGGGVTMPLVLIRPGSFTMGDQDAKPAHQVTISRPFYIGRYEVTLKQWAAVMGSNASDFKGPDTPVETASWEDCQTFLRALNEKIGAGRKFALPTEAQWEYACRAGGTGKFCYVDDEAGLGEYAWYASNSASTAHPGGQKKPNAWGLYDMHGNVWEWCADWYGDYGAGAETDPAGAPSGIARVLRGGSWLNSPTCCRAAYRNIISFGYSIGCRVVCDVPAGPGLSE